MKWSPDPDALRGRVAVVAGATRGAGRGIAAALGEAGATVVCTGRSTRAPTSSVRSDYARPETIEETAKLDDRLRILRLAIDTHLITSHHLLPLLIDKPGGLVVEVTDGTTSYNDGHYRISVFYDLAKVSVNRLAFSQGHELESHGATAVAITPGWLRSEMMLEAFDVTEENWRDAVGKNGHAPPDFALSESPRYVGRAVVALASDPDRARWNQHSVSSGQLAGHYQFTDVDGSRPDVWRYMAEVSEGGRQASPDDYR
jgi:NAD(P)-dependent dehydrogenase (short-subunit alcohol dehydrogenase family)